MAHGGLCAATTTRSLPNLTLNFGVRYEYDEPWIEENNKTGNIDLSTGQVIYAGHVPTGAPAGSGLCSNRGLLRQQFPADHAAGWALPIRPTIASWFAAATARPASLKATRPISG